MGNGVSSGRTLIEWTLSAAAIATIAVVILSVDSPVRGYAGSLPAALTRGTATFRIPEPLARASRNTWRICMDHQPLAAFTGVACVLVLFMRRMR